MADRDRNQGRTNRRPTPRSRIAQAGHFIDPATGALTPPLHRSTTFARDAAYAPVGGYVYGRDGGPTLAPVEELAAELDGGAGALLFASGMAAFTSLFETVETGRHIVAPRIMYHGGQAWLRRIAARRGIALSLVDAADPAAIRRALRPGETAILWIESLLNPTWDVVDIADAAEAAHAAGAILGVDATVSPPPTTRPIELGADIVFHSATKYLNGHSDVSAGLLVTRAEDPRWRDIQLVRKLLGGVPGPGDAWLLLRGMRTLYLRYEQASQSAMRIARHFEGHPGLRAVLYPGLASHSGHAVACRQMRGGFGGMLSIRVRGDAAMAKRVATGLDLFLPATSLGGVESLVEHRATVEGPDSAVPPDLLRLSIGIEDCDDLIADLEQSLARAG